MPQIERVPGVAAVHHDQWFGGIIGDNTQAISVRLQSAQFARGVSRMGDA